ncbi:MAG: hypothetical protein AB1454_12760 [Candidatus Auribacterota bacterium]
MKRIISSMILAVCGFIAVNTHAMEFQVNSYTTNSQTAPAIAFGSTNYMITWTSTLQDGNDGGVYGQLVNTDGSFFGGEFKLNTYTTFHQDSTALAFDGTNYLVTWRSYLQDGNGNGVFGRVVSSTGSFIGNEFQINTYTTAAQRQTSLAFDGSNYLVTWHSDGQDGSSYGVYGQRVSKTGSKVGGEFRVSTYTPDHQTYSDVAFDGTNYLVTWQSYGQDGAQGGIYGQRVSKTGSKVGSEFQINTYTSGDQTGCAIEFDGTNYLVIWQGPGQDGNGYEVFGQLVAPNGAKVGDEFRINTYTLSDQDTCKLSFNGQYYLVVWESYNEDGSMEGIVCQYVDTDGNLVGEAFVMNDYILGNQGTPDVAWDGTNFLITWQSYGQDGDAYGIYADFLGGAPIIPVPEPCTIFLFGLSLIGVIRKYLKR